MVSDIILANLLFQQSQVEELNPLICQSASRSYLVICLTIAAVFAVVGVLLKLYWDRRHMFGSPHIRFGIILAMTFVISTVLVALEPIKDELLLACRESEEFSRYVIMPTVTPISRGLVLGGVVSAVIYFLILIALSTRAKRK